MSQSESESESELELELESELESEVEAEVELEELELEDAYTKKRGRRWRHAKKRGRHWRHAPVDPSLFIGENGVCQLRPFPEPPPSFWGLYPPPPPGSENPARPVFMEGPGERAGGGGGVDAPPPMYRVRSAMGSEGGGP